MKDIDFFTNLVKNVMGVGGRGEGGLDRFPKEGPVYKMDQNFQKMQQIFETIHSSTSL